MLRSLEGLLGRKPRESAISKPNIQAQEKMTGGEFLKGICMLHETVKGLEENCRKLRPLPVGSSMDLKDEEYVRALGVAELRKNILDAQTEIKKILKFAEVQTMSGFTGRISELRGIESEIAKLLKQANEIIVPEEWRIAV